MSTCAIDEKALRERGFAPRYEDSRRAWTRRMRPVGAEWTTHIDLFVDTTEFYIDVTPTLRDDPNDRYDRFIKPAIERVMDATEGPLSVTSGPMNISLILPEDLEPVLLAVLDDVIDVLSKRS